MASTGGVLHDRPRHPGPASSAAWWAFVSSAPPLARALYFNTDIGQEIPAGLFVAVAQLLAYVYQLKTMQAAGLEVPLPPADLPVPDDLLRHH